MRMSMVWVLLVLLSGCSSLRQSAGDGSQSPWWSVALTQPAYMDVWVENVGAIDMNDRLLPRITSGGAARSQPGLDAPYAEGWRGVGSSSRAATGAALPKRLYVRWQSVVEEKTYKVWFDLPEEVRTLLKRSQSERCKERPDLPPVYESLLSLGLAPGGVVQVWVWDECYQPIKSIRVVAEEEPRGPHLGKATGYYPLSEQSRRYIERWGIPYGSW